MDELPLLLYASGIQFSSYTDNWKWYVYGMELIESAFNRFCINNTRDIYASKHKRIHSLVMLIIHAFWDRIYKLVVTLKRTGLTGM